MGHVTKVLDEIKDDSATQSGLLLAEPLVMLQSLRISDKRRFLVVRSDISSAGVRLPEGHID